MKFLRCPECGKKGVNLRLRTYGEDHYGCRYCDWFAFTGSSMDEDIYQLKKLQAFNTQEKIV